MTLKVNRGMLLLETFLLGVFMVVSVSEVMPRLFAFGSSHVITPSIGELAAGCAFAGAFVSIISFVRTPALIETDEENIIIKSVSPGSGIYTWNQLEGWYWDGLLMLRIKFEGREGYQIQRFGFGVGDWRRFISLLEQRFSQKRTTTWAWFGPYLMKRPK
jgi:hypothetical protein